MFKAASRTNEELPRKTLDDHRISLAFKIWTKAKFVMSAKEESNNTRLNLNSTRMEP